MSAKTRQELAKEYNVNPKTFRKWLKSYEIELPKGALTPEVINKIYKKLGVPKDTRKYQKIPENTSKYQSFGVYRINF